MHQAMVWAKAADHHGASGIMFSATTRVKIGQTKYCRGKVHFYEPLIKKGIAKPLLNLFQQLHKRTTTNLYLGQYWSHKLV